jgi:Arc/MetJ-type ribon-helix-helix transcriptional regulator
MKPIEITIPEGLYNYIQKLVNENNFESIESFVKQATFLLAELHGFGEQTEGKGLNDIITDLIISKIGSSKGEIQKVKTVVKDFKIPNKDLIIESFSSSKFMFEDAIFASCQFAALKQGNPPVTKEEFARSLNQMEEAGILTQIKQGEKMMWKRNE